MAGYLLDTNHLSSAVRKNSELRERIRQAHRAGERFATGWPALCELEAGICQTARPEAYRRTLRALIKEVRIWGVDWDIVRLYGELFNRAKKTGRVLSHVDLVLAGLATHAKATLLTTDRDFEAFPELKTANWIGE